MRIFEFKLISYILQQVIPGIILHMPAQTTLLAEMKSSILNKRKGQRSSISNPSRTSSAIDVRSGLSRDTLSGISLRRDTAPTIGDGQRVDDGTTNIVITASMKRPHRKSNELPQTTPSTVNTGTPTLSVRTSVTSGRTHLSRRNSSIPEALSHPSIVRTSLTDKVSVKDTAVVKDTSVIKVAADPPAECPSDQGMVTRAFHTLGKHYASIVDTVYR